LCVREDANVETRHCGVSQPKIMTLFRDKYRIESIRKPYWDYSSPGSYFVTICTAVRDYIRDNPANWQKDELFVDEKVRLAVPRLYDGRSSDNL
jgi:hypothetical protein